MAILAECDICGNQHRVKDGLVGSSIRCKDCGVLFLVPPGPVISAENYIDAGGRLRLREPNEEANSLWPRFIAGLVAALVIGALAGSVWALVALVRPVSQNTRTRAGIRHACSAGTASSESAAADEAKEPHTDNE